MYNQGSVVGRINPAFSGPQDEQDQLDKPMGQSVQPPYYPNVGYQVPRANLNPIPSGYPNQPYGAPGGPQGPYAQQSYSGMSAFPQRAQLGHTEVTVQPAVFMTSMSPAAPAPVYMCYSIFTMLCCFLPLGSAAVACSCTVLGDQASAGEQSSTSSIEDTSTSADLLKATLEMEVIGDVPGESSTSISTDGSYSSGSSDLETSGGVSSSEDSEKVDLLAELQAAAMQPAIKPSLMQMLTASSVCWLVQRFPNLGNTCYMNSVLQCLLTVSPVPGRCTFPAGTLRALADLHMTRLTGNDKNLKAKDTHEFLMVCLAHLKEEGGLLA
ncbi:hypothetical protein G5714_012130 [Onychostoma macrolepis]|uniref:Peptidase C19 ubiquitin carboxyl-terminal hydrolase domain-containing protein n=1 Tax=Onychostoma macrolepis TaxID=369639 RepID=A0A7J6CKS8_9TELE|nr:hypothetical protein G5714_012130 [Onychostoma macrolepis]